MEWIATLQAIELAPWVATVALVLVAFLPGTLLTWLVVRKARHVAIVERSPWLRWLSNYFRVTMHLFLPAIFLYPLAQIYRPELLNDPVFLNTWQVLITLFFVMFGLGTTNFVTHSVKRRYDLNAENNFKARRMHTKLEVIHRIVSALIIILGVGATLMMFEEMRGLGLSLLASAGLTGVVIGFSAQKVLGNLIAGIQIAFTQPISIEDAVVVEGEWGWIEEITLTYVVVKIWDRRRLVLPISYFTEQPFQNWTRGTAQILGSVYLDVDYRMPIEPLRAKLDEILESTTLWDGDAKVLQVVEATETTLKIRALMTAKDSPTSWDLRCYVREHLIGYIQQDYPQYLPRNRVVIHEIAQPSPDYTLGNGHKEPTASLPIEGFECRPIES